MSRPLICAIAVVLMATPAASQVLGSGGAYVGRPGDGCRLAPAACLGAGFVIPGGSAGGTGEGSACAGRIVTPETGGQSDSHVYCVGADGEAVVVAPPSHARVVAVLCPSPPVATVRADPAEFGVTGMTTTFSTVTPAVWEASGQVDGFDAGCRLRATVWVLDSGDVHAGEFGHRRTHSTSVLPRPGGSGLVHLWERKDHYRPSLGITWVRTTTTAGRSRSDRVVSTVAMEYTVNEIRPEARPAS